MLKWLSITGISFLLCGLLTNDIPTMIGLTMSMSFFVGIGWELINWMWNERKDKGV